MPISLGGRSALAIGGGGALVASVIVAAFARPALFGRGTPTAHRQLLAAFADGRPVDGRLVGLVYQPVRAPRRAGDDVRSGALPLQAAIAAATQAAAADPSTTNSRALAIARLALGQYDQAVSVLEQISARDEDGTIASDLAAAYLARAQASDRREDFGRALAAAQRALRKNPSLAEARFNRALALEGVLLGTAAQTAWRAFLEVEPSGGWAVEARQHLESADLRQASPELRQAPRR